MAIITASATLSIGETACEVLYFDPSSTESVDTVEIKAVGSSKTVYLPGALINSASLEVKILKGENNKPEVGKIVDLVVTLSESTNGGAPVKGDTVTVPCFVQQVAEDRIEGDGASRLGAYVVTLQPTNIAEV